MARERRDRGWWAKTVREWKSSGLTARQFARRHGVSDRTLTWWSSMLRRGTRAKRESTSLVPLEVKVARPVSMHLGSGAPIEIAVGDKFVRVEVGTDVEYVAVLVERLRSAR